MITTKIITSEKDIESAAALLHQVYIEENPWTFKPDNPSHLRVEERNGRKLLIDRFSDLAIWIGAFDNDNLAGCIRLCGLDKDGKYEIEGYPSSSVIRKYLYRTNCLELTRAAIKAEHKGQKILLRLYLAALEYCRTNHSSVFGCANNPYVKSVLKKIEFPLKVEHAFKYEEIDPSPTNFYFADYNSGEVDNIISRLKLILQNRGKTDLGVLEALDKVANILPVPVYWHDTTGKVLGLNEQCLKGMGSSKDIIGKTPYDFYPRETAEHIIKHNELVMKKGEVLSQEEQIQDITTGEIKHFSAVKAPLYDDEGRIIGIVGTSIDISAEKRTAQLELEVEAYQAEQKAQARFKALIDEIQHAITKYQVDVLNNQTGIKPPKYTDLEQELSLTKREEQTLYYLSLHKSPKEIAAILSLVEGKEITASSVQSVIDKQLYRKLDVNSISMLIDKAKAFKLIPLALSA